MAQPHESELPQTAEQPKRASYGPSRETLRAERRLQRDRSTRQHMSTTDFDRVLETLINAPRTRNILWGALDGMTNDPSARESAQQIVRHVATMNGSVPGTASALDGDRPFASLADGQPAEDVLDSFAAACKFSAPLDVAVQAELRTRTFDPGASLA